MLAECVNAITMEIEYQQRLLKTMKKRWKDLSVHAGFELYANYQRNNLRYYVCKEGEMKKERRYVPKNQISMRRELQERYYLEHAMDKCRKNIEMLDLVKDSYYSLDPADVVSNSPLAYREQENAMKMVYGYGSETTWKKRKLVEKSKYQVPYPEHLKHIAGDGTITRSKSEALIIDLLNMKGIPYVYDFPMHLGDRIKWPDFIILDRKHNRELVIEHLGKMSDEGYLIDQEDKLGLYIREGYVPNVDLLLTFDDRDGNINVPAISKMIDAFICK